MKVKLIGILNEKLDFSNSHEVNTAYHLSHVVTKYDYEHDITVGHLDFLRTQEHTLDFVIRGEYYILNTPECNNLLTKEQIISKNFILKRDNLTKEQITLMDSLKKGDVIVFDANLCISPIYFIYDIYSYFSKINNIEKYDDKNAADKIRLMVSKMPLTLDELGSQTNY